MPTTPVAVAVVAVDAQVLHAVCPPQCTPPAQIYDSPKGSELSPPRTKSKKPRFLHLPPNRTRPHSHATPYHQPK